MNEREIVRDLLTRVERLSLDLEEAGERAIFPDTAQALEAAHDGLEDAVIALQRLAEGEADES